MREELSEMKEMNGDYVVSVAHQVSLFWRQYISFVNIDENRPNVTIMAYGSTPYVGMTPKKMAATLKVHK